MHQKKIEMATADELRKHATEHMMIDVPGGLAAPDIIAMIRNGGWASDSIPVDEAVLAPAAEAQSDEVRALAQVKLVSGDAGDDPKWLIKIAATELPGGRDPVPLGVNGQVVVITRGKDVEVPHRFIEVLNNAVRTSVSDDPKGGEPIVSDYTNYPFQILRGPPQSEIDAWKARQAAAEKIAA